MSKTKTAATGRGYLGEIMVHRISHQIGIVENVVEGQAGWPPEITVKLKDGSFKKGRLSDFRDATHQEKKDFPPAIEPPDTQAKPSSN